MGTCCIAHLATMVQNYALNAENGAVTVKNVRTRTQKLLVRDSLPPTMNKIVFCTYCQAPSEFEVSYYAKEKVFLGTTT